MRAGWIALTMLLLTACDGALIGPEEADESERGVASFAIGSQVKVCNCTGLFFRAKPSKSGKALDVLSPGERGEVLASSGSWYQLRLEDAREGWAHGGYLCLGTPAPGPAPSPGGSDGGVAPAPTPTPTPPPAGGIYQPKVGARFQWQLSGTIDPSPEVDAFDLDLFDVPASTIAALQAKGRKVICYFSAGSYEAWRPDAANIPTAARGSKMDGWDELWLDVRSAGVRAVMKARLDLAKQKGCDGVEPDNVDGYANATGFSLSAADQLDYNKFLAAEAHARGLSIGLKNDLDQVKALEPYFDFAVNEQCLEYGECGMLSPFIAAGKAVFHVEYQGTTSTVCPKTAPLKLTSVIKKLDLGAWAQFCPTSSPTPTPTPTPNPTPSPTPGAPWSCTGSYGTKKASDGIYYTTSFGCWVDSKGVSHSDPGDNCIPACLSQAKSSGLCQSSWSGKTCEEKTNWYVADSGRFGCLQRLKLTANGKSVVVVVLDAGPACWVEAKVQKAILDMSPPTAIYLFGTSAIGATEKKAAKVVEVPASTPLGPS